MPPSSKRKHRPSRPSVFNGDAVVYRSVAAGALVLLLLGVGIVLLVLGVSGN